MTKSHGFTLIEILIALAIFAIVAVITAVGLRSVLHTHEKMQANDQRLRAVLTAVTLLRRDVNQLVARQVLDTSGSELPALLIPDRHQIEFTRMGYTNPEMTVKRSSLERVGYEFSRDTLYRLTWPVLDRAPETKVEKRVLLKKIKDFKLSFINNKGQLVQVWADTLKLPRALILTLTLKKLGKLELVLPIRGRGYATE